MNYVQLISFFYIQIIKKVEQIFYYFFSTKSIIIAVLIFKKMQYNRLNNNIQKKY